MEQKLTINTDPVEVDFGDGKQRYIKYSIAAVKRVRKLYGSMKELLATDIVEAVPGLVFAGLVDENGKPTTEFDSQDDIEALIPYPLLGKLHGRFMYAFYGVDIEKLNAEAEAKKREEKEKNSQVQMTPDPLIQ